MHRSGVKQQKAITRSKSLVKADEKNLLDVQLPKITMKDS